MGRDADRFVDDLLRGRRPEAFTPTEEELAEIRAAIALAAARPDADRPRDAFVAELRERVAAQNAASQDDRAPAPGRPRPRLTPARRRFLRAGAVAASAFTVGFVTDHCLGAGPSGGAVATEDGDITSTEGVWHTVAAGAELPEGSTRDFDLGAVVGFVHRASGRLRAVSGICTHQACRLTLDDARTTLVCPCHGATFAPTGAPLHNFRTHDPLPPLPRLPVREHDGLIQVYGPAARGPAEVAEEAGQEATED